jgi:hypothetical protein
MCVLSCTEGVAARDELLRSTLSALRAIATSKSRAEHFAVGPAGPSDVAQAAAEAAAQLSDAACGVLAAVDAGPLGARSATVQQLLHQLSESGGCGDGRGRVVVRNALESWLEALGPTADVEEEVSALFS